MSGTDPGDATTSAAPPRRAPKLLRSCGVALAVALTAAAMWLVVTSTSRKALEIGVLLGLWAIVIGASFALGTRQHHDGPPSGAPDEVAPAPVTELDLRRKSAIERSDEAAERRAFQNRLEEMVRAELRSGLAQEVAGLRSDVAGLRQEIVENLGGQLKLERIETTRLIGSDLEALHQAVRELGMSEPNAGSFTVTKAVQAPAPAGQPVPQTVDVEVVPEPAPAPAPDEPAAPVASAANGTVHDVDPFAAMPRLTPFHDVGGPSSDLTGRPVTGDRVADGSPANAMPADGSASPGAAGARPTRSGRRHREDDSQNDTLARILRREGQRSS